MPTRLIRPGLPLWMLAGLLAATTLAPWPSAAALRALVAGVDDYPGDSRLQSCVNDARAMAALLTTHYPANGQKVRVLLDADASAPGLRRALQQLVEETRPGDQVLFYFSGHGALVPDWSGERRVVKAFVPHGIPAPPISLTNLLTQTELKQWLARLSTTNITVVLDCCHAGSITRGLADRPEARRKVMNVGFAAAEVHLAKEASGELIATDRALRNSVLWLGACQSNQVSYCGSRLSQFTAKLVESVAAHPEQRMAELFPAIRRQVEDNTRNHRDGVQTPVIEGVTNRPLVSISTPPGPTQPGPAAPALPTPPVVTDTPPPQPFALELQINAREYQAGDLLKARVVAGADCYLRLYLMNAATDIQQLFPNRYASNNFVQANQPLDIPAPNTFVLRMTEPFGTETLIAVASPVQFSDLDRPDFSAATFMNVGAMRPAETMTRGIVIEPAAPAAPAATASNTVSVARVQYTVRPR